MNSRRLMYPTPGIERRDYSTLEGARGFQNSCRGRGQCPLSGLQRTWRSILDMSAATPIADIARRHGCSACRHTRAFGLQGQGNLCYQGCAPRIVPENPPAAAVQSGTLQAARTGHDNDQGERR